MSEIFIILVLGLVSGLASGLFGIGGAVIIVPLLVSVSNYPHKMSHGTTLLMFIIAPSILAGIQYYKAGNANVKTAVFLWIGVFIGAAVGAWLVNSVFKDSPIFTMVLKKSFSVIMIIMAVKMWFS